ncbi:MAG: hypothetical protein ACUZ77_00075 [Candidatus Brocadiales bacterium]
MADRNVCPTILVRHGQTNEILRFTQNDRLRGQACTEQSERNDKGVSLSMPPVYQSASLPACICPCHPAIAHDFRQNGRQECLPYAYIWFAVHGIKTKEIMTDKIEKFQKILYNIMRIRVQ